MIRQNGNIVNALTVDVEDYYHVQSFADRIRPDQWDDYPSRVVANTHRMLRLLDRHQVRGTFFILGWVAERFPQLVRDVQRAGHEIGCHSYWHRLIYQMTPGEFRDDLALARKTIEDIIGEPVVAYRAPSFSVTNESLWALDILIEQGFQYDSSIFPVHHDNYGIPGAERFPHRVEKCGVGLWEFPPSVHRFLNVNVPIAGGGYFRIYPARLSLHWLGRINRVHGQPFMFYIHPWELDPDQPRLPASWKSRFRHYQNLRRTEAKLTLLLNAFRFDALAQTLVGQAPPDSAPLVGHAPPDSRRLSQARPCPNPSGRA